MKEYSKNDSYVIYHGNMLDMLDFISPNSIDSIVTDPPYGLTSITKRFGKETSSYYRVGKDGAFARLSKGFMGKEWDGSGIEYNVETWKKCFEILKPGGYLLAFGGSRTFHKIASSIENAGFEIRDCIMWLYGSGFPKSMNISKGIEAKEKYGKANTVVKRLVEQNCEGDEYRIKQTNNGAMGELIETTRKHYIPHTSLSNQWNGWGTCLKPAYEPIIIARKPFKGSLVDNVITNGVGGINIDECKTNEGRFPSNVVLTFDESDYSEVCGNLPNGKKNGSITKRYKMNNQVYGNYGECNTFKAYDDEGNASRYFYCAKASRKDRDEGLGFRNTHPTIKPTELMQYLVRLVTPKGGIICDPFMGSGSTGKAVMYENQERNANYKFIGIEITEEYLPISEARLKYALNNEKTNNTKKEKEKN